MIQYEAVSCVQMLCFLSNCPFASLVSPSSCSERRRRHIILSLGIIETFTSVVFTIMLMAVRREGAPGKSFLSVNFVKIQMFPRVNLAIWPGRPTSYWEPCWKLTHIIWNTVGVPKFCLCLSFCLINNPPFSSFFWVQLDSDSVPTL